MTLLRLYQMEECCYRIPTRGKWKYKKRLITWIWNYLHKQPHYFFLFNIYSDIVNSFIKSLLTTFCFLLLFPVYLDIPMSLDLVWFIIHMFQIWLLKSILLILITTITPPKFSIKHAFDAPRKWLNLC